MDADIIVVGGGFAGLTVAARAGELGRKTLILEQGSDSEYACNSRWSGGHLSICMDNPKSAADALLERIMKATCGEADEKLAGAFAGDAGKAIDWLQRHGIRFMRIGDDPSRQWVMIPPRTAQPGLDWKGRGPDIAMRQLTEAMRRNGGELALNTRVGGLLMSDGRCEGVVAVKDGVTKQLRCNAVVLADGGFQANEEYVRRFVAGDAAHLMRRNAGTGRGDGLRMAESAGAKLVGMDCFYGHLLARDAFTNDKLWPHPYLDALAVSGIVVGADGRRFLDEGKGGVHRQHGCAPRQCARRYGHFRPDRVGGTGRQSGRAAPAQPHPQACKCQDTQRQFHFATRGEGRTAAASAGRNGIALQRCACEQRAGVAGSTALQRKAPCLRATHAAFPCDPGVRRHYLHHGWPRDRHPWAGHPPGRACDRRFVRRGLRVRRTGGRPGCRLSAALPRHSSSACVRRSSSQAVLQTPRLRKRITRASNPIRRVAWH